MVPSCSLFSSEMYRVNNKWTVNEVNFFLSLPTGGISPLNFLPTPPIFPLELTTEPVSKLALMLGPI